MKISIVIPTYNRRDLLARTLPTVFDQDFPGGEFEVVVVIDGSTDGTAEMLRHLNPPCGFQIIEQPNRGQAAAKNVGLRAARGELVLFMDDDILCGRGVVAEHVDAHEGAAAVVAFGPVYISAESRSGAPT